MNCQSQIYHGLNPNLINRRWFLEQCGLGSEIESLPEGASPTQLAAWTTVARVLLNLDETITKE